MVLTGSDRLHETEYEFIKYGAMSFELKDISGVDFQLLNHFFTVGFESNKLVEQSQTVKLPFGSIQMHEWYFDGIRMAYSDWIYNEPAELKWNYDINVELITFQANLKGSVLVGDSNGSSSHLMRNYQHNLFYSSAGEANSGKLKCERSRNSMFFIQFTKDAFIRLTQDANEVLNRFAGCVLKGTPTLLSYNNLPVDAVMQNAIGNIVNCSYKDGLKKMFLLSKSIEFLVLQAEACNTAAIPSYRYIKTDYDRNCIMYAREYIMSHLDSPPSLSELAKIAGINEYKLKRGFKETFGNTVFGYLSDARLEIARNDLLETRKPASEIASELGYSSVQHFSNAFKKKFGLSPNKLK